MQHSLDQSASRAVRTRAALALAVLVPAPTIGVLAAMWFEATAGPIGQAIYIASKAWILAVPLFWLLVIERGRLSWSPVKKGGIGVGALLGLAIAVVIGGVWLIAGDVLIDPETVRATAKLNALDQPIRYIVLASYLTIVNALLEEYVWRWFVFRQCEKLVGAMPAVFLSAGMFTLHHVFALRAQFDWLATLLCSVGVFVGGGVWSWCYLRFRSIWPGYLSHAIVDAAIFIIGWQLIF